MKQAMLVLLGLHLAAVPCLADVIPVEYADAAGKQQQVVADRMTDLGVPADRAGRLSSGELAYFAAQPERIQAAGGLYWYEWLLGAGVLAGIIIVGVILHNERADRLD